MPGSRGNTRPESGNTSTALLFVRRQNPAAELKVRASETT